MRKKVLWSVAAAMLVSAGGAFAEEDGVSVGAAADVFSKYIWRGQNIVDDWVFQPSASIGYKGLTGTIWGNMDLHGDVVDDGQFNEIDYVLDYSGTFAGQEVLGYSLGAIYYDFPNTDFSGTTEIYGGLSLSVPLSPAITWYYDFDEIDGSYIQLSVGHTIEKFTEWAKDGYCGLQVGASLAYGNSGYNHGYFAVDDSGLNDLALSLGLPICMGNWTIKPVIAYSTMIDDDIREATGKSNNLWGGISLAVGF